MNGSNGSAFSVISPTLRRNVTVDAGVRKKVKNVPHWQGYKAFGCLENQKSDRPKSESLSETRRKLYRATRSCQCSYMEQKHWPL